MLKKMEMELINEIKRDFPNIDLQVKTIKIKSINIQDNDTSDMCLICRDDSNTKISCNHFYHKECINKWIKKSASRLCPCCRKQLELITIEKYIINWNSISRYQKLSEEFIEKFQDKVKWKVVLRYQELSEEFIEKFQNKVNWYWISIYQKLTEKFIEKFQDKINWKFISRHQKLSEEFIEKFQDKVDWTAISKHQKLSEEFIEKFRDKVHWGNISRYQKTL